MELTQSDIQKLVKIQEADTFWNHFVYTLKKDHTLYGEIGPNKVKVWQKTNMTGAFYPVYTFEFNSENELIKIKDKLNPFAQFSQLLFPLFFFFPLLSTAFHDFEFKSFLICIIVFIILTFACYLVSNKIYKYEKKEQLKEFYKTFNIKTKEAPERELNKSQMLTRLFTYPICFTLILLIIFVIIPEGGFFIAIPILGIIGVYLYSDLKLTSKDKK